MSMLTLENYLNTNKDNAIWWSPPSKERNEEKGDNQNGGKRGTT